MARIRTIKPEFWTHPVTGRLPADVQALACGLLNYADDEGYFYAEPGVVRGACRPFDEDSTNVRRGLDELSRAEWIEVREHPTHGRIGRIVNFAKHQKIDRPRPSTISCYFSTCDDSTINRRSLDEASTKPRRGLAAGMEWNGKGMEGNGNTSVRSRTEPTAAPPADLPAVPVDGKASEWQTPQATVDELQQAFPSLDVSAECRKAIAWLVANPTRRKTAKGMPRFLFGWMERAQNRGSRAPPGRRAPLVGVDDGTIPF